MDGTMEQRNWIRGFAVILGILGVIGAFILGEAFAIPDFTSYSYSPQYNWGVVAACLGGVALTSGFFLALASIFDQQQETTAEIRNLIAAVRSADLREKEPGSLQAALPRPYAGVARARTDAATKHKEVIVTCPKCNEEQSATTPYCRYCSTKLK